MIFLNRKDAGKKLARAAEHLTGKDVVVLALPRGGVVLGLEVAKELKAPLGLVLVRKIGHPSYPEYAIGAVAEGEKPIYNQQEVMNIDRGWLAESESSERALIAQRKSLYYGKDIKPPEITNKTVIIVDDGIATGLTMDAAVRAVRNKKAKRIVVAVPVAPQESIDLLKAVVDEVLVLDDPDNFRGAVGSHYKEFDQVTDEEVVLLLREARDEIRQKIPSKHSSIKAR